MGKGGESLNAIRSINAWFVRGRMRIGMDIDVDMAQTGASVLPCWIEARPDTVREEPGAQTIEMLPEQFFSQRLIRLPDQYQSGLQSP